MHLQTRVLFYFLTLRRRSYRLGPGAASAAGLRISDLVGFLNTSLGLSPDQIDSKKPTKLFYSASFLGQKMRQTLYLLDYQLLLVSTVVTVVAMLMMVRPLPQDP